MQQMCVKEREGTIKYAAPAYAGRGGLLTLSLQYVFQTIRLGETDPVRGRRMEPFAAEALHDFEVLGSLIVRLGISPVFTACPPYPVSYHSCASVDYAKDFSAMLEADLRLEAGLQEKLHALGMRLEGGEADIVFGLETRSADRALRLAAMKAG